MAEHQVTGGGEAGGPPVACSLTSQDLASQEARWQALAARAMTGREETADGIRVTFEPGPGVAAELCELATAESECCPWARWTVQAAGAELVLTVRTATEEGIAVLHGVLAGQGATAAEVASPAAAGERCMNMQ